MNPANEHRGQSGDVDSNGDILDEVLLERLSGAIGPLADDVAHADQLDLVLLELARCRSALEWRAW